MTTIDGITIAPSPDLEGKVRAVCDMWIDTGFAPGSSRRSGINVSGFGRSIRRGQLVDINDPVVRPNLQYFETVPRPLVEADFKEAK
jgi:hypothetical protein